MCLFVLCVYVCVCVCVCVCACICLPPAFIPMVVHMSKVHPWPATASPSPSECRSLYPSLLKCSHLLTCIPASLSACRALHRIARTRHATCVSSKEERVLRRLMAVDTLYNDGALTIKLPE